MLFTLSEQTNDILIVNQSPDLFFLRKGNFFRGLEFLVMLS